MSFTGNMTPTEDLARKHFLKLNEEVRRGIFSEAKFDLLFTNPDEFLTEYLANVPEEQVSEVIGIIKHVIVTGFFRSMRRKSMADEAERN